MSGGAGIDCTVRDVGVEGEAEEAEEGFEFEVEFTEALFVRFEALGSAFRFRSLDCGGEGAVDIACVAGERLDSKFAEDSGLTTIPVSNPSPSVESAR